MKKIFRFLTFFVFVIAVSVFPFNQASAQYGLYVGVLGGYTFGPVASWENRNSKLNWDYDLDIQTTGIFGAKFGGFHPDIPYFSLEFEYNFLNPDVKRTVLTTAGNDYSAIEGDVKLHNFMFNIILQYPPGRIHPYFGAGLGATYFDFSLTSTSRIDDVIYSERRSSNDTVFAWQLLTGVNIDLTNNLSLDVGCRYFATEYADYKYYDDEDDKNDDYHYEGPFLDFRTFMVTLGLRFRF